MKVSLNTIPLLLLVLFLLSCSMSDEVGVLYEKPGYQFPYRLNEPNKTWELPSSLVEISGLGVLDGQRIACIQDEEGIIFIFNKKTGKIEKEISFGEKGDYEGIEIIDKEAWVLKSNGNLYRVKDFLTKPDPKVKRYKTALSGRNNTEGLALDRVSKKLLIACKGDPFTDDKGGEDLKAIYSFDLKEKELDKEPFLLIDLDTIRYYKNYSGVSKLGEDIKDFLNSSNGSQTFQPSGIAVHPVTRNLYVLGAAGNLLVVFSPQGQLLAIVELYPSTFPQPEGICFSHDGSLYIASEGAGWSGVIMEFTKM
jgi:uncharacterized protein YjiK